MEAVECACAALGEVGDEEGHGDRARRRFTWVDVIPGRPDVERLLLGHSAHGAANTY